MKHLIWLLVLISSVSYANQICYPVGNQVQCYNTQGIDPSIPLQYRSAPIQGPAYDPALLQILQQQQMMQEQLRQQQMYQQGLQRGYRP